MKKTVYIKSTIRLEVSEYLFNKLNNWNKEQLEFWIANNSYTTNHFNHRVIDSFYFEHGLLTPELI